MLVSSLSHVLWPASLASSKAAKEHQMLAHLIPSFSTALVYSKANQRFCKKAHPCRAENVANMLENPVSPTMRLVDQASIAWLDGCSATGLQATRDLDVPNADGLTVLKVHTLLYARVHHVHFRGSRRFWNHLEAHEQGG